MVLNMDGDQKGISEMLWGSMKKEWIIIWI